MVETQPIDVVGDAGVLAALRECCADIPRRNLEIVTGGLTVELRVEVESLFLDDLLHVGEKVGFDGLSIGRNGGSCGRLLHNLDRFCLLLLLLIPLPIFRCLGNLFDKGAVLLIDNAALVDDVGGEEQGHDGNDGEVGTHDAEVFRPRLVPLYLALLLGGVEAGGVEGGLAL